MSKFWSKTVTSPDDADAVSVLQVVAYNLRRARELRGLTQAMLGQELSSVTGSRWSSMTVGHAESGWALAPGRIRHFDAAEIVSFAYVLKLPIAWFFLPPPERLDGSPGRKHKGRWIALGQDEEAGAMSSEMLASYAVPEPKRPSANDPYLRRLWEELPQFSPAEDRGTDERTRRLMQRVREAIDEYESHA